MEAWKKLVWFLIGTFFGWLVLTLLATVGGVALTAIAPFVMIAIPTVVLGGIGYFFWWIFAGRK